MIYPVHQNVVNDKLWEISIFLLYCTSSHNDAAQITFGTRM